VRSGKGEWKRVEPEQKDGAKKDQEQSRQVPTTSMIVDDAAKLDAAASLASSWYDAGAVIPLTASQEAQTSNTSVAQMLEVKV
jgi:hypothetical protein